MPGFDIIGSKERAVAIIEPTKQKKKIVAAIMQKHKNVKSILMKASARRGVYRLRKLQLIAGSRNTEVVHTESGCRFLLDPRKVYFSPREGTERLRIAEKINEGELVAVFFAGVGPFAIVLSRKSRAREVVGIEKNPIAVKYFKKNIELNKLNNVIAVKSDVKNISKKFPKSFDRILMPLPESAIEYLNEAAKCLKPNGIVHLYFFSKEDEINTTKKKIKSMVKKANFLGLQRVLPYGPGIYKYRIDIQIK
jgi:tRNA (guanine37-N1)-methyltransferase